MLGVIKRAGLRQAHHCMLGGVVGRKAFRSLKAGGGGDVDDGTFPGIGVQHGLHGVLDTQEGRGVV